MSPYEYYELRRVSYGSDDDEWGRAYFVPVCPNCGRFVKRDSNVTFDGEGQPVGANATCRRCGRIQMPFEGYL